VSTCTGLDVRNIIISHIQFAYASQEAYGVGGDMDYTFEYNDVYYCETGFYESGSAGTGCISVDPGFVNPGDDFHLGNSSSCRNAGDPAILDVDSSRSDMGAYGGPGGEW
jgi:hypothetical protein